MGDSSLGLAGVSDSWLDEELIIFLSGLVEASRNAEERDKQLGQSSELNY